MGLGSAREKNLELSLEFGWTQLRRHRRAYVESFYRCPNAVMCIECVKRLILYYVLIIVHIVLKIGNA
jgi:hypothetical protein